MSPAISFVLDNRVQTIDLSSSLHTPTTTVLNFLRAHPHHKGVKEGCAEGDCGACTVVIGELTPQGTVTYKAVDSCLVFVPMLHGKQLVTVEDLASDGTLHPVQDDMVKADGSQCGFCTPGFVMSLFALFKEKDQPTRASIDDALTGNLCRCTGYRPIVEAAARACAQKPHDGIEISNSISDMLRGIRSESITIRTKSQEYVRPISLAEALAFKKKDPDSLVICGATDIALRVTKQHEHLPKILDIGNVSELSTMRDGEVYSVGAAVTLSDLLVFAEKRLPALSSILSVFGSRQIRNLATIGGNLGSASPIGDILPVLMAYGTHVELRSVDGRREVPLEEFIVGYRKTVRKDDELITGVMVPRPWGAAVHSYKVSKRKDLDISTVNGGFRLSLDPDGIVNDVVLVFGGVAAQVLRARATEMHLLGKKWSRENIESGMAILEQEFSPISDARGGAEFRRVVTRNLLMKLFLDTMPTKEKESAVV